MNNNVCFMSPLIVDCFSLKILVFFSPFKCHLKQWWTTKRFLPDHTAVLYFDDAFFNLNYQIKIAILELISYVCVNSSITDL